MKNCIKQIMWGATTVALFINSSGAAIVFADTFALGTGSWFRGGNAGTLQNTSGQLRGGSAACASISSACIPMAAPAWNRSIQRIEKVHAFFKRPVWITEFAVAGMSQPGDSHPKCELIANEAKQTLRQ